MSNIYKNLINPKLINQLNQGDIGIIPTDTLYGLCCLASNKSSVLKIQQLKGYKDPKPMIILIDSIEMLSTFGAAIMTNTKEIFEKVTPNSFTILIKHIHNEKYNYIYGESKYCHLEFQTNQKYEN
jgi:tRNA A37 threonylcarbamoyladenosine synthetase subunit TsaC/SUA5/YrdC